MGIRHSGQDQWRAAGSLLPNQRFYEGAEPIHSSTDGGQAGAVVNQGLRVSRLKVLDEVSTVRKLSGRKRNRTVRRGR